MAEGLTKARLISRRMVTDALAIITLEPEAKVNFLPGQYVALGIQERGQLIHRDYSIASSPYDNMLEFFIERVDEGDFTVRLFRLEPGAEVLVTPPQGTLLLDRESGRPHHLMIATVTGIAPFLSMVRTLVIDQGRGTVPGIRATVLHGASNANEFGYEADLRRTATTHPWLTYIPVVSRPTKNPGWQGETGRVETVIEKTMDARQWSPRDTTAYLCGHPGMIEQGKKILKGRGFLETQVREEQYWEEK